MFAVIKTGGKQYKVATNDEIVIEKLDTEIGEEHVFGEVLMLGGENGVTIGAPLVAGAAVTADVLEQRKGDKVLVVKKQQRSTYRRKNGHRQLETVIRITAILPDGVKAVSPRKKAQKTETVEEVVISAAPKAEKPKAKADTAAPVASERPAVDARGRLSAPVNGQADDLKVIKGVGPVLEKKLNAAGIFHYWQVAALTAEQVVELETDMSFPGRITRDNWLEQAAALASQA
jgi:large subunit ribosomal protein L21